MTNARLSWLEFRERVSPPQAGLDTVEFGVDVAKELPQRLVLAVIGRERRVE
jgi:hypothetical protein